MNQAAAIANLVPQKLARLGIGAAFPDHVFVEIIDPQIRQVLGGYHFYDANRGGGLWLGRHYGAGNERVGDPVGDHSHAATVRQLLRFFLLLEQGRLISADASRTMREIFLTPEIPHDDIKFVNALANRPGIQILRKWGSWPNKDFQRVVNFQREEIPALPKNSVAIKSAAK